MTTRTGWRQTSLRSSFREMSIACPADLPLAIRLILIMAALSATVARAGAQEQWVGVGAIGATTMYMDTTTIIRAGTIRKVWVKSLDIAPKSFVVGKDTLTFDTVIGLNVFDCAKHTRTVTAVQYLLGEDIVLDVPETHAEPEALRPKTFFDAIYHDLCGSH